MAATDPSSDVIAELTDQARIYIARASLGNVVFKVVGFGLGRGGYDPSDFTQTEPLVPGDTELEDKVYPDDVPLSYEPLTSTEETTATVRVYNCRVGATTIAGNADYGLGELGLYAEVTKSDVPSEVGSIFLFAHSHFPVVCKTRRDTFYRRVIVSYGGS